MFEVNGHSKVLGIIGNPVEHSYSPQMHNFISEKLGLNYVYLPFEVKQGDLEQAIEGVKSLGIVGVNITAPYKYDVIEMLDEISEQAKLFGSVNTVKNVGGKLYGYNTDADGFYKSLLVEDADVVGKDILILGAGGAARPVSVKFSQLGAKSITILNRTQNRADELADFVYKSCNYKIHTKQMNKHYDVAINTTSVGMHPNIGVSPIEDYSIIDEKTVVADMIYNPSQTLFLKQALENGAKKCINGLGMLIYQGIIAYEIFTDTKLSDDFGRLIQKEVFGR